MINDQNKHIALLFFSRTPLAESRKKKIMRHDEDKNRKVTGLLIKQTLQSIEKSGLPVFIFDESRQKGNTFGERLANAYDELFSQGFKGVVAVGNDCPGLASIDWTSIAGELLARRSVIGPTPEGGSYLIGLTKDVFHKKSFQNLPWKTSSVYKALIGLIENQNGQYLELAEQRDINRFEDLKYFLKSNFKGFLKHFKELLKALFEACNSSTVSGFMPQFQSRPVHITRPPPFF